MTQIAIVGCGVVGAAIAYELSLTPGLHITVLDQQAPAKGSTGAALGVLMGAISQKVRGNAWELRRTTLERYRTLLPELEAVTGRNLGWNRQGIVKLRFDPDDQANWENLVQVRQQQGYGLELWDREELDKRCPHVLAAGAIGAVYSPQDLQIDPTLLTLTLVEAATQNGVAFQMDCKVVGLTHNDGHCTAIQTSSGAIAVEQVILTAGLGTAALMPPTATPPLSLVPVLGQAVRIHCPKPLGDPSFQPVITGNDIHLVPLEHGEYWVGATVEFPAGSEIPVAHPEPLEEVWQGAIALWPDLATAEVLHTWSGLRPRPQNRPAPVIEKLPGYPNVIVATGHYRNGVLLAPGTALRVKVLLGVA